MARISKRLVDATTAGPKPIFTWDQVLPGFALLTLPTGTKSYVFQYRNIDGRARRITIAKVGALTPDQARTIAEGMSALVKAGGDPLADKTAARTGLTLAVCWIDTSPAHATPKTATSASATASGKLNGT